MRTIRRPCLSCHGTGRSKCLTCHGTGRTRSIILSQDRVQTSEPCGACGGKGTFECAGCNGRGYTEQIMPDIQRIEPIQPTTFARFDSLSGMQRSTPTGSGVSTSTVAKSSSSSVADSIAALIVLMLIVAVASFGFKATLVAAEGFFIFAGWAGLQAGRLFRKQDSEWLEAFRATTAIGFGVSGGLLAAYLLLTTPEGRAINAWVTAQTTRLVASLFATLGLPFVLDQLGRLLLSRFTDD